MAPLGFNRMRKAGHRHAHQLWSGGFFEDARIRARGPEGRFAQAMGTLEKHALGLAGGKTRGTDRIDAGLIARYAAARQIQPQASAAASQDKLKSLARNSASSSPSRSPSRTSAA